MVEGVGHPFQKQQEMGRSRMKGVGHSTQYKNDGVAQMVEGIDHPHWRQIQTMGASKQENMREMGMCMIEKRPGNPKTFRQNDKWPNYGRMKTRKGEQKVIEPG